jgi:putative membrane protein
MRVTHLVSSAIAGLALSAVVGVAPAAAQRATTLASDSTFMQAISSIGLLQAKLAKLAQDKATSTAVQELGKRLAAEYAKTNQDLAAAAKQAAFPSPTLMRQHQQIFNRFDHMSKSAFDKAYAEQVVSDHNEAVRLYQDEAESGRIASLKQLAASMLPDAQEHLAVATQTAGAVGADVTASNGDGKKTAGSH